MERSNEISAQEEVDFEFVSRYLRKIVHNRINEYRSRSSRNCARTSNTSDVVQSLLVKLVKRVEELSRLNDEELHRYLAVSARNATRSYARKLKSSKIRYTFSPGKMQEIVHAREDDLLLKEVYSILSNSLSEEELDVVYLALGGSSYREIFDVTRISFWNVRKIIYKSRLILQEKFPELL